LLLAASAVLIFAAGWFTAHGWKTSAFAASSLKPTPVAANAKSAAAAAAQQNAAHVSNQTTLADILAETDPFVRTSRLYAFLATLDAPAIRALLKQDFKTLSDPDRWQVMQTLMQRLAEVDPLGVFDELNQKDNSFRLQTLPDVIAVLAGQNPQKILALINHLPPGTETSVLLVGVFATWAARDPVAAAAAAQNLPPSPARDGIFTKIAAAWAAQDPAATLAWINSLPPNLARTTALNSALSAISAADPQAATAYLDATTSPQQRAAFIQTIATDWAKQDPAAALAWIDQNTTGPAHDNAVLNAVQQAVSQDAAHAAAFLARLPANLTGDQIEQLTDAWSEDNPQLALNWLQSLPPSTSADYRQEGMSMALQTWSAADPVAAAAYLSNLASGNISSKNLAELVADPAAHWSQIDPAAAFAWGQQLPDGPARVSALGSILSTLSTSDPQTAWDYAQQLPDGDTRDQITALVVEKWSDQDAAQTAAIFASLPPGKAADDAAHQIAGAWAEQNPVAASAWVNTLPQGATRDGAITSLVEVLGWTDPQSTFTWASSASDPATQFDLVNKALEFWAAKDPAAAASAAQTYEQSANLTTKQISQLNESAKPLTRGSNLMHTSFGSNPASTPAYSGGLSDTSDGSISSGGSPGGAMITTISGIPEY
jgi:hypothetical protein